MQSAKNITVPHGVVCTVLRCRWFIQSMNYGFTYFPLAKLPHNTRTAQGVAGSTSRASTALERICYLVNLDRTVEPRARRAVPRVRRRGCAPGRRVCTCVECGGWPKDLTDTLFIKRMFADCALSEGVSEQAEGWRRARASTTSRSSTRAPPKPGCRGRKARRAARPRSARRAQALAGHHPLASAARGEAAARSRARRRRLAGYPPRAHCPPLAWRHPPPLRPG